MANFHHSLDNNINMQEPSIDNDKLSYEIFSILESKFLFGYDDHKGWIPKQIAPAIDMEEVSYNAADVVSTSPRPQTAMKNQRGKVCILSIDGGGMRNIIAGKALAYLENVLKSKSGNPDARIADFFDVATGSGVGGIFTAMLFASKDSDNRRPIFHAEDTWKFLAEQGKKIYSSGNSTSNKGSLLRKVLRGGANGGGGRKSTNAMEKSMKEAFVDKTGRSLTLKDTIKPVLIPCYDLSSTAPFLFSRADALETDSFDFRLWEVCRATSSEPTVFEPVVMKSIDGQTTCVGVDGGLAMSNPTAAAITHVLHNKQEFPFVRGVEDILVLSLGNGQLLEGSLGYDEVKNWKAKDWARPLARISGDGSAELVDHAVAMAFGQSRRSNYVRIQATGSSMGGGSGCGSRIESDVSGESVRKMVKIGEEMLKQKNVESVLFSGKKIGEQSNLEKLEWFAGELIQEHQKRSCRIAPTVAFKQSPAPKSTS